MYLESSSWQRLTTDSESMYRTVHLPLGTWTNTDLFSDEIHEELNQALTANPIPSQLLCTMNGGRGPRQFL